MKKLLYAIMAAMLCFALVLPFASFAEDEAEIIINGAENVSVGDEVTVIAEIKGQYSVHCVNFAFEYDVNALELISAEQGEFLKSIASAGNLVVLDSEAFVESGRVVLGIACPIDAMTGSGELVVMRFKVKQGVTVNPQVTLYVSEFASMPIGTTEATPVKFSYKNAIITLVNGSEPSGGYNEGSDGGYQGDPLTPVPGYTAIPQETDSDDPAVGESSTPEVEETPLSTEKPSDNVSEFTPTAQPGDDDTRTPDNSNKTVLYVLIGVVVACAAGAVVLIVKTRKK